MSPLSEILFLAFFIMKVVIYTELGNSRCLKRDFMSYNYIHEEKGSLAEVCKANIPSKHELYSKCVDFTSSVSNIC